MKTNQHPREAYFSRAKTISESVLSGINIIRAVNTLAVHILTYAAIKQELLNPDMKQERYFTKTEFFIKIYTYNTIVALLGYMVNDLMMVKGL